MSKIDFKNWRIEYRGQSYDFKDIAKYTGVAVKTIKLRISKFERMRPHIHIRYLFAPVDDKKWCVRDKKGQKITLYDIIQQCNISEGTVRSRLVRYRRGEIEYKKIFAPKNNTSRKPIPKIIIPETAKPRVSLNELKVPAFAELKEREYRAKGLL